MHAHNQTAIYQSSGTHLCNIRMCKELEIRHIYSVYHPKNGLLSSIKWYVKYLTLNRYAFLVMGIGREACAMYLNCSLRKSAASSLCVQKH
jgi:hypothetical protein